MSRSENESKRATGTTDAWERLSLRGFAVPGGDSQGETENGQLIIDANSQFHINGLVPATYDVSFLQESFGAVV